jgi:glycerol-3-phosphate acyltransferase PlsX
MSRSWRARIGYLFARSAFQQLRERMDPRRANGGVFLGLNGIVIKSHGGADAEGVAAALDLGHGVVRDQLLAKIKAALAPRQAHRSQMLGSQAVGGAVLDNKAVGGAAS